MCSFFEFSYAFCLKVYEWYKYNKHYAYKDESHYKIIDIYVSKPPMQ